jgi:hypothetical protein
MPYRVYRREPVRKGDWYHTVSCNKCGLPIYLIDDITKGRSPAKPMGAEKLLVPCLRCGHDDLYELAAMVVLESTEELEGGRPARIPISKSSRKPLWKTHPKARGIFGVGFIEDRPAAAVIVARIITSWADIEVECARLLAELMNTNIPAAAAVFGSLRSSRAQHDALSAAAEVVLDARDFELFSAYMARKSALEKERNDPAHGCFGVSPAIPHHVVWVAQVDFLLFSAKRSPSDADIEEFNKKQFVYELGTLERISQEIQEFYQQLGFFIGYLFARHDPNGPAFRAQRYPQLCSQPHIQPVLDRIRTAKKAEQVPRKGRS